ncbi:MAG: GNAT family N-acetyltransferase [Anaerolineae bacterium]|nr:GNAT family N-acetyltransferase [Anaerolineae bacterium]
MTIDSTFAEFPLLTTARLHLRQIQLSDADDFFGILSDEETTRYYGHPPHRTIEDTRALIHRLHAFFNRQEAIRWGVTLRGDDRLIGSCSLFHFDDGYNRAETGYELNRAYWGQGMMTEAMTALLDYGFENMELHRIEAIIDIANERSKGLLLKLGFTYEGNLRERYDMGTSLEDEHYFGLLRREWHASHGAKS